MMAARDEKGYETHAWVLLFSLGLFGLALGLGLLAGPLPIGEITGLDWDEASAQARVAVEHLKTISQWIFFFSIFTVVVSAIPYRKGEKWAWYAMWALPVNLIIGAARDIELGITGFWPLWWPMLLFPISMALLGLLLPLRKFFPSK